MLKKHQKDMGIHRDSAAKKQIKKATVNALKFLFSTVGLVILTFAWLLLGGWVFQRLETPFEESVSDGIRTIIFKKVKDNVYNITGVHFNTPAQLTKDDLYNSLDEQLLLLTAEVYKAIRDQGWNGKLNSENSAPQWSYPNAVLYSATVVTTIGYGHITPKTKPGRILTIVYALIGIPITLLTLAKIGHAMGISFRFMYYHLNKWVWIAIHKVCPCCRNRLIKKAKTKTLDGHVAPTTNDLANEGTADQEDKSAQKPLDNNANAGLTSSRTTAFPDMTSVRTEATTVKTYAESSKSARDSASSSAGAPLVAAITVPAASASKTGFFKKWFPFFGKRNANSDDIRVQIPVETSQNKGEEGNLEESDHKERKIIKTRDKMKQYRRLKRRIARDEAKDQIRVPISISFLPVVAYVVLGSWLFSFLNDDWSFLVGCYFCFTTISTIGFGDFVYGFDAIVTTDDEYVDDSFIVQKSLIITCFYIMFGLSLNSMCIDLVAYEITQKVRQLGLFLGLIKSDDDSDAEDD